MNQSANSIGSNACLMLSNTTLRNKQTAKISTSLLLPQAAMYERGSLSA
ncbi:hypothetical protein [Nostoc sp.]